LREREGEKQLEHGQNKAEIHASDLLPANAAAK
jgi:hypothetical protein